MKFTSQSIIAISNLILAAAVSFYVLKPPTAANLTDISTGITTLNESVDNLTRTVHRFNTTTLQLDYLQNEIGRLANIDRNLINRIQAKKSQEAKTPTADGENRIKQLTEAQSQVQKELKNRREGAAMIISGLERQLQAMRSAQNAIKNPPSNNNTPNTENPSQPPVATEPAAVDSEE